MIKDEWRMMKDEGWRKNDEWWGMNDEGWWFQAVEGFCRRMDKQTDICDCRVTFATENSSLVQSLHENKSVLSLF